MLKFAGDEIVILKNRLSSRFELTKVDAACSAAATVASAGHLLTGKWHSGKWTTGFACPGVQPSL